MTYRERREARAARLQEWADKRRAKADGIARSDAHMRAEIGFVAAQPGIGALPAVKRLNAREEKEWEHRKTAGAMASRAAGIEDQLDRSIYSDDPDAIERLQERIDALEAERERVKAYNASARKAKGNHGDLSILTESEQATLISCIRFQPYACKFGQFPAYHLANLGGNIARQRERLEQLQRPPVHAARPITVKYAGECGTCGERIDRGADAGYFRDSHELICMTCWDASR